MFQTELKKSFLKTYSEITVQKNVNESRRSRSQVIFTKTVTHSESNFSSWSSSALPFSAVSAILKWSEAYLRRYIPWRRP